jgi:hypothetical protein
MSVDFISEWPIKVLITGKLTPSLLNVDAAKSAMKSKEVTVITITTH